MRRYQVVFSLLFLMGLSSSAMALSLADIGGSGVKEYVGLNNKAWVYRTCKVVVMGTTNIPVVYFSVADSHNEYIYWTYSKSFVTGSNYGPSIVTASDSMNLVYKGGDFPNYRAIYKNVGEPIDGGGNISELFVEADGSGRITAVKFRHLSPSKGKVLNEVLCDNLQQRPTR